MSEEVSRGTCRRYGEDYEPYMVLIPENIVELSAWQTMKKEYEWFCHDCFKEEHSKSGIAILQNGDDKQ